MTRRRGAGEKGARRRCHQAERCAKYDLRGAQPDVRIGVRPQSWARRIVLTQDAGGVVLPSAGDGAASLALGARHWKR